MSNCNKHHILFDSFIKQGWEHFQEWEMDVTHIFTTQFLGEAIRVRLPCLPAPGGTLHAPLPPHSLITGWVSKSESFCEEKGMHSGKTEQASSLLSTNTQNISHSYFLWTAFVSKWSQHVTNGKQRVSNDNSFPRITVKHFGELCCSLKHEWRLVNERSSHSQAHCWPYDH